MPEQFENPVETEVEDETTRTKQSFPNSKQSWTLHIRRIPWSEQKPPAPTSFVVNPIEPLDIDSSQVSLP
jgi:hypothetical protein